MEEEDGEPGDHGDEFEDKSIAISYANDHVEGSGDDYYVYVIGSLFSLGERDTPPDYQEAGCLLAAKSATAGSTGFLASWGNEKETNNGNMFLMHLVFIT